MSAGPSGSIAYLVCSERLEGVVVHDAPVAVRVAAGAIGAARPVGRRNWAIPARTVAAQAPLFDDLSVAR